MASMKEITCKCGCGRKKMVRVADIARGWGKFYSKSCKARFQEKKTGQHKKYLQRKAVAPDPNNYLGSGVDKETFEYYAEEYGGTPCFNHKGEYEGFIPEPFDNTQHQNSGD